MDKKKVVVASSSSSSSPAPSSLDHLFGPRDSSSSSATGFFNSIFPTPAAGLRRQMGFDQNQDRSGKYQIPDEVDGSKRSGERRNNNEYNHQSLQTHEEAHPCHLSSSIYYGGQENYSAKTNTNDSRYINFKKDGEEADSESASRGNWWKGSLYY